MDCSICCETIKPDKKGESSTIRCVNTECQLIICKTCFKTDILTRKSTNCPGCKTDYSLPLVRQVCTKSFYMKEYADIRAISYIDREKSMLRISKARLQYNKLIKESNTVWRISNQTKRTLNEVKKEFKVLSGKRYVYGDSGKQIQKLINEEEALYVKLRAKLEDSMASLYGIIHGQKGSDDQEPSQKKFDMPCPEKECVGVLCNWKCTVCQNYFCAKCREPKKGRADPDHVCDENILASLKDLRSNTKPCPGCNAPIFKTEGCRQMWCTVCKTAFDYYTGKIETGTIHNPHYMEFRRQFGAEAIQVNVACNCNQIDYDKLSKELAYRCSGWIPHARVLAQFILECHQFSTTVVTNYSERTNSNIRENYLTGKISEEKFHTQLRNSMLNSERRLEISMIYTCLVDSLVSWIDQFMSIKDHKEFTPTFRNIILYAYRNEKNIDMYYGNSAIHYGFYGDIARYIEPQKNHYWLYVEKKESNLSLYRSK